MSAANLVPIAPAWGKNPEDSRKPAPSAAGHLFPPNTDQASAITFHFLNCRGKKKCQTVTATPKGKLDMF